MIHSDPAAVRHRPAQRGALMVGTALAGLSMLALATPLLAVPALADTVTEPAADTAAAGELPTIIVTARRVEENLQEVPLTIRVLTAEEIDREGVRNLNDVARLSAGLSYEIGAFPNDTRPSLRGLAAERGRPSVAIMLDGQDLSGENLSIAGGTAGVVPDVIDIERIEVVKGPQSVLFGRNAFAGAINFIPRRPSFTPEGMIMLEAASGDQASVGASWSGPIIPDLLAVRVNAAARTSGGFYSNPITRNELGVQDFAGGTLALRFTPTQTLTLDASWQTTTLDMSDLPTAYVPANARLPVPGGTFTAGPPGTPPTACPPSLTGLPAAVVRSCTRGVFLGELRASERDIQMGLNEQTLSPPDGMETTQDIAALRARWQSALGDVIYSYGWLNNESIIEQDGDFTSFPAPPGFVLSLSVINQLDYENQHDDHNLYWTHTLGAVDLLLGVQVFREESSLLNNSRFWLRNPASPLGGPPFFLSNRQRDNGFPAFITRDTSYEAVYGRVRWSITDRLRLGLENRYSREDITYTIPGFRLQDTSLSLLTPRCIPGLAQGAVFAGVPGPTVPPPGVVVACPRTEALAYEENTPRVTLDYRLTDDLMVYAIAARGYKPGGFNTNEVIELTGQSYLPEFVDALELGFKSQSLDRSLLVNAAIYHYDYTDQQIGVQRNQAGAGGTIVAVAGIVNAAAVESQGGELEVVWFPLDQLELAFSYAYTDATFQNYVGGPPPGSPAAAFTACGVPQGQTSSDQFRTEAGNACADFSGRRVPKTPEHALNASAIWRQPIAGSQNSWFAEVAAQHRSERFTDESNLTTLPAYTNVDLRVGLELGPATLMAFVQNATDDDSIRVAQRNIDAGNPEGFAPGRAFTAYLPTPRVWGVRTIIRFQ
jgi:outer membrane receptor protein involved in Fe transport